MMNPFTLATDWLDENADFGAPLAAFVGITIAFIVCVATR
jgi:hypothetical protein